MSYLIPMDYKRSTPPPESRESPRLKSGETAEDPRAQLRLCGIESRTRVSTSFGDVPTHLLRVNDTLRGQDGRFLKIRSIDALKLDAGFLKYHPDAYPVRIGAGAFGPGRPAQDIYVAPDQEVGIGISASDRRTEIARNLLSRPKVGRAPIEQVAYYLIDVGERATIMTEKAWLRIGKDDEAG